MNDHLPHLPAQETCEPASHGEYYYDTWVHRHGHSRLPIRTLEEPL